MAVWTGDSSTVTADSAQFTADGSSAPLSVGGWTADSSTVTADSPIFTADGGSRQVLPPGFFRGGLFSRPSSMYGWFLFLNPPQFIRPAPRVVSNAVSWETACRIAGRQPVEMYPVYTFGGGTARRTFYQKV